jgi:radical SAM protein with 4Fe4S-binding SPASM domain
MSLFDRLRKGASSSPAAEPPVAGLHHFLWEENSQKSRVHLRIDPDGSGLLIVNASKVFQLNPSASTMAYFALSKLPEPSIIKSLSKVFDGSKQTLAQDYKSFNKTLNDLITGDACPICELNLETTAPFSSRPTAPYRMDLAITYRCNNACAHCYNGRSRDYPELNTDEWIAILDILWKLGIPHIVFTGGEPTLRDDLPILIRHAEKNGQITGLNTNGRRLKDADYLNSLVESGLDHVQITLESHIPEIHDLMVCHKGAWQETITGIKNVLKTRLYVMTNTTMLTHNSPTIPATLEYLAELGLPTVGLNALIYSGRGKTVGTGLSEADLQPILTAAQQITSNHGQRLIWYTPTQYCHFDPVQMGLGVKGCTAALFNMCIEPDGSVIPCQSYYQSLGNILKNSWNEIWNHELAVSLRERKKLPEKCKTCMIYNECGGGCPLTFSSD